MKNQAPEGSSEQDICKSRILSKHWQTSIISSFSLKINQKYIRNGAWELQNPQNSNPEPQMSPHEVQVAPQVSLKSRQGLLKYVKIRPRMATVTFHGPPRRHFYTAWEPCWLRNHGFGSIFLWKTSIPKGNVKKHDEKVRFPKTFKKPWFFEGCSCFFLDGALHFWMILIKKS